MEPPCYGRDKPAPKNEKTFITILAFDNPSYWYDRKKLYASDLECYVIRIGALDKSGDWWSWHHDLALSNSEEWCKQKVARFLAEECAWRTLPHVPGDPIGEAEEAEAKAEAERIAREKWERDRRIDYRFHAVDTRGHFTAALTTWMGNHFAEGTYEISAHPTETNKTGIIIKCGGLTHEPAYPGAVISIEENGLLVVHNLNGKHCPQCGEPISQKCDYGFVRNSASSKHPDYCAVCKGE